MSKKTKEDLIYRIDECNAEQLRQMLHRIVFMDFTDAKLKQLTSIIEGVDLRSTRQTVAHIALGRVIPVNALRTLADSYMMDFVPDIIEAALRPDGPHQTREIMMIAALNHDKAPYLTPKGIPHSDKVLAGYILSMAGFERKSAYDRNTKRPVKAWKPRHGFGRMTPQERAIEVFATIEKELNMTDTPMRRHEPTNLDELI